MLYLTEFDMMFNVLPVMHSCHITCPARSLVYILYLSPLSIYAAASNTLCCPAKNSLLA